MTLDLIEARLAFLALARPSVVYCRQNGVDWINTEPACGGVYLAPISPWSANRFEFDRNGMEAAVCEAIGPDGVSIVDLVAWSLTDPAKIWTVTGSPVIGENVSANPATYALGLPLRLFRTPLAWLRAGCDGIAVLDMDRAARWLLDSFATTVAPEDDAHAAEYHAARLRLIQAQRIVVPEAA